jgi:hypothetical protein
MKRSRVFRPGLQAAALENRVLPASAIPGTIVLTTGGYVLTTSSPGAALDPGSAPGGGVSGALFSTSLYVTGSGGLSSPQAANQTGVDSRAIPETAGSSSGPGATVAIGSGANTVGSLSIPLVTRNTIAFDNPSTPPVIGRRSWDHSPVLPVGQIYRGGIPAIAPSPASPEPSRKPMSPRPGAKPSDPAAAPLDTAERLVPSNAAEDRVKISTGSDP